MRHPGILLIVIACFMFSCEKEIVVVIPDNPSRLVIEATLVPYTINGKYLGVKVHDSKHIFDSITPKPLTNATVLLYRNQIFMDTLQYLSGEHFNFYPLGFAPLDGPKAGETYQVKISADNYEPVFAETSIPEKVDILDVDIDRIAFLDEDGGVYSALHITFKDQPDKKNYYEIVLSSIGNEYTPDSYYRITTYETYIISENHYPPAIRFDLKKPKYLLFNDQTFNGEETIITIYYFAWQIINRFGQRELRSDILSIQLRNVSEEYYKYRSTLLQSLYNHQQDILYGMGEPLNVYSNVENGHGIFAGFNNSVYSIELDSLIVR